MRKSGLLLLLLCLTALGAQAQPAQEGKAKYVELPRSHATMLIATQPDCPLRIKGASVLYRVDEPGIAQRYKVRNVSNKNVRLFTVTSWAIGGSGGTLPIARGNSGLELLPGETFEYAGAGEYETVPFTPEVGERLKRARGVEADGRMRSLFILMIDQVYFSDGIVYRDINTSKALQEYLDRFIDAASSER